MKNIILDCDPGHDDAIAIILAAFDPEINLLGISVASGNQTLQKTGRNAMNMCKYLGINVPIALGSPHPIKREVFTCPEIHGESGLDGFDFPKYEMNFDQRTGMQLIIDTVMNNDDVTVVTTGPMTNLGLAIKQEPKILNKIKEIVFMGGSTEAGNTTPYAEFNIYCDPEAADIVMKSGVPVKMIGLNVTRRVLVDETIIERMDKINNVKSDLFTKLMQVFLENQRKFFKLTGAPLHDPVTIVSLIDEQCVKFEPMHVDIDTTYEEKVGQTKCSKDNPNCLVAVDVDIGKYWDIVERNLRA